MDKVRWNRSVQINQSVRVRMEGEGLKWHNLLRSIRHHRATNVVAYIKKQSATCVHINCSYYCFCCHTYPHLNAKATFFIFIFIIFLSLSIPGAFRSQRVSQPIWLCVAFYPPEGHPWGPFTTSCHFVHWKVTWEGTSSFLSAILASKRRTLPQYLFLSNT